MKKQQTYWDWTGKGNYVVGDYYAGGAFKSLGTALRNYKSVDLPYFNWETIKVQSNKVVGVYSVKEAERILKIGQL